MVQLGRTSTVAFLLVGTVFAQTTEGVLRSRLTSVHYAPLAEQARIQGDVRLRLNSGVVTLISGHPLLAPIAVESATTDSASLEANARRPRRIKFNIDNFS